MVLDVGAARGWTRFFSRRTHMYDSVGFIFGWRGFLMGSRRGWHAHHRWGIFGTRGGNLIVRGAVQSEQFRACSGLLVEVFSRGGTLWLFGAAAHANPLWGRVRRTWRPGALSNYFFARLKRTHFVRRVLNVFQPRRFLRRRAVLVTRWARLRADGGLPVRHGRPCRTNAYAAATGRAARGSFASVLVYYRAPRAIRHRGRWSRLWWLCSAGPARGYTHVARHVRATPARHVISRAARVVRHVQHRRAGRARRVRTRTRRPGVTAGRVVRVAGPGKTVPTRLRARHPGWPRAFPAALVGGGLDLFKATLLNEVTAAGLPFVRFGGTDFTPRAALFEVYWNPSTAATGGLSGWIDHLFVRAHRTGLFRVCWHRLGRLAER